MPKMYTKPIVISGDYCSISQFERQKCTLRLTGLSPEILDGALQAWQGSGEVSCGTAQA